VPSRSRREQDTARPRHHAIRTERFGASRGKVESVPVSIDDVRRVAEVLPRSYEVLVHDRVKFRVGKIVWLAFSRDETQMGFAFPREEREVLVASEPEVFLMPRRSDLRFNWVEVRLEAIDVDRMREIVIDAWRLVVPKTVALAQGGD
jgi:hypothetical protein